MILFIFSQRNHCVMPFGMLLQPSWNSHMEKGPVLRCKNATAWPFTNSVRHFISLWLKNLYMRVVLPPHLLRMNAISSLLPTRTILQPSHCLHLYATTIVQRYERTQQFTPPGSYIKFPKLHLSYRNKIKGFKIYKAWYTTTTSSLTSASSAACFTTTLR